MRGLGRLICDDAEKLCGLHAYLVVPTARLALEALRLPPPLVLQHHICELLWPPGTPRPSGPCRRCVVSTPAGLAVDSRARAARHAAVVRASGGARSDIGATVDSPCTQKLRYRGICDESACAWCKSVRIGRTDERSRDAVSPLATRLVFRARHPRVKGSTRRAVVLPSERQYK